MRARPRHVAPLVAALALLSLVAGPASAQKAKLHLERADVSAYPLLKLYLSFVDTDGRVVTGKLKDDFKLIFDSNEQGVAADAKSIDQTGEPAYIVVVAQVSGAMHEVFDDEKRGIKLLAQAAAEIKGSKMGLIGYAQETKRLAELGRPEDVAAAADSMQEDAEGAEAHLIDALRTAIDQLNAKGVPDGARKLIVVFSDGIDVGGAERKVFLPPGRLAVQANIVIDTIGYAPFEAGKLRNLSELAKQTNGTDRACKNAQEVGGHFSNVGDEVKKLYVALFRSLVACDARDHTIQVLHESSNTAVYSNNVIKICECPKVDAPSRPWWFWPLWVGLPLLVIVVLLLVFRKGEEPMPEVALAPAPSPEGPQRTMALDISVGAKGPTIGWIVGMSGRYTDQTFKLLPQRTVIGTSNEADIRIEDPKVSRKHCEIRYDGQGYKIFDLDSTNGVILNDRRIPHGELVDGDSFRLGTVEFKFKSIN